MGRSPLHAVAYVQIPALQARGGFFVRPGPVRVGLLERRRPIRTELVERELVVYQLEHAEAGELYVPVEPVEYVLESADHMRFTAGQRTVWDIPDKLQRAGKYRVKPVKLP